MKTYLVTSTDDRRFIVQSGKKSLRNKRGKLLVRSEENNAIRQAKKDGIEIKSIKLA